jgi:multidrug resistance protein, MATE family
LSGGSSPKTNLIAVQSEREEECVPLLHDTPQTSDEANEDENVSFTSLTFFNEAKILYKLGWPTVVSYTLAYTLNSASVFSLGHIGTIELASIALAVMLCNVTGFSVGMGTSI